MSLFFTIVNAGLKLILFIRKFGYNICEYLISYPKTNFSAEQQLFWIRQKDKNMIKKVVKKRNLNDSNQIIDDLSYWLNKPSEERIAAVEYLRRQYHGSSARLQRTAKVVKLLES